MGSADRDSNRLEEAIAQASLFSVNDAMKVADWYGLRITHRQLIDSLEYEYLNSFESAGLILGLNKYAENASSGGVSSPVYVYLRIDPELLPLQTSLNASPADWHPKESTEYVPSSQVIVWPHVLPLSCVKEIAVLEEEHLQRLASVEYMAGNLRLPLAPVLRHDIDPEAIFYPQIDELHSNACLPPRELDAYRGSICMAFWGVPKMRPWINALCESLRPKGCVSKEFDSDLPSWIRILPWDINSFPAQDQPESLDDSFWKVAIPELVISCDSQDFSAYEFVDRCAGLLMQKRVLDPELIASIEDWQRSTIDLLNGTKSFKLPTEVNESIPIALQMVLLRPKPEQFRSWVHDYPDVPVAIWFAGLLLCGLLAGYHRLPLVFRGYRDTKQPQAADRFNQLLLLFLLQHLPYSPPYLHWPHAPQSQPTIRDVDDRFHLYWDQKHICSKRSSEREAWLKANLHDPPLYSTAITLAKRLGWNCTHSSVLLTPGAYTFSKKGHVELQSGDEKDKLSVVGESVELAGNSELKATTKLDIAAFRRCILQNGGDFRRSDLKQYHPGRTAGSDPIDVRPLNASLVPESPASERINGLNLVNDFLSKQEEEELVRQLDAETWEFISDHDSRRVQHYGWRYLYKAKKVSMSDRIGPLPSWADELAYRLASQGLVPYVPNQVIVNEYLKKQGIAMHIDCLPCFDDFIVSISLLEEWTMKFQKAKQQEFVSLPRRSALVLSGAARSEWKHGIDKRVKDPSGRLRDRRISLTFRKVKDPL